MPLFRCDRCRPEHKGMRHFQHDSKADGSPVSAQEEIDVKFTTFKDSKKHRHRNTETGGAMHMMDSDFIVQDAETPDCINVAMGENPNDGNCNYEWAFNQIGIVIDDSKHKIVHDVFRHKNMCAIKLHTPRFESIV